MSRDELIHRALANPVRTRLLAALRDDPEPNDVEHLAATVDLHPNTVRSHLSVLEAAGLVERDAGPAAELPRGPGRPRVVFCASDAAEEPPESDGYRFLATMLAGSFAADVDDAEERALRAGEGWGRYLVDVPPPGERLSDAGSISRLVELLDRAGFAPEVSEEPGSVSLLTLHRCPFPDLARRHPDVVCSLHLGMMRGALSETGAAVSVRSLAPSFDGGPCLSVLEGVQAGPVSAPGS